MDKSLSERLESAWEHRRDFNNPNGLTWPEAGRFYFNELKIAWLSLLSWGQRRFRADGSQGDSTCAWENLDKGSEEMLASIEEEDPSTEEARRLSNARAAVDTYYHHMTSPISADKLCEMKEFQWFPEIKRIYEAMQNAKAPFSEDDVTAELARRMQEQERGPESGEIE